MQIEADTIKPFKYPFDLSSDEVLKPKIKNRSKIII